MMSDKMALKIAVDLMHVPSQVRLVRSEPLPDGILMLLRIAAGEAEAERDAAALLDRSQEVIRRAAAFFIEQILFAPNADSYRVLGATSQASASELRRNAALLLKWLHPDMDPRGERSIFVGRVTAAWNDLKTPERRAAYDAARNAKKWKKSRGKTGKIVRWQRGSKRPFSSAWSHRGDSVSERQFAFRDNKAGLLRRALSLLFHTQ